MEVVLILVYCSYMQHEGRKIGRERGREWGKEMGERGGKRQGREKWEGGRDR